MFGYVSRCFVCALFCAILAVTRAILIVLCFPLANIFFSLIFRRDADVFAAAILAGAFLSTAHPYLFPAVSSMSIVGYAPSFVLPSSSFWMLVAPLFFVVSGVTGVPSSIGVALLVALPRDCVCISSDAVMRTLPLCRFRCTRV